MAPRWPRGIRVTASFAKAASARRSGPCRNRRALTTPGRLVRRGRDLVTATYAHIGPEVPDRAKR
jgi:hypothetical protein